MIIVFFIMSARFSRFSRELFPLDALSLSENYNYSS
jgi:hypothetical protein